MKEISLHILDIFQNSIRAGATQVGLAVEEDLATDTLRITVTDDGKGMSIGDVENLSDPFFTTRASRRVGLGIPLLRQNAERCGGRLEIESAPGKGTAVHAYFGLLHIDRPPMGDLAGTFILTAAANPGTVFTLAYTTASGQYAFDTREARKTLNGANLSSLVSELTGIMTGSIRDIKARA